MVLATEDLMSINCRHILFGLSLLLLAGCSDIGDPVSTQPAGASFRADVQPIFSSRCAVPGCHIQPSPQAGCDLSVGPSYANIVGVPAIVFGPGFRVAPGSPDASVLYRLVNAGTMPAQGGPLTPKQIETIREWIEDGAQDN